MASRWTKISAAAGAALLTFSGGALFAAGNDSSLQVLSDFENGQMVNYQQWIFSGNPPVVTTERARAGKASMKSALNRATSITSFRTEVALNNTDKLLTTEQWWGFSIFLPNDFVADPIWEIVAQWHGVPDEDLGESDANLNPPLSLHTENGEWTLYGIWDSRPVSNSKSYEGVQRWPFGTYERNKWTDFVFHIKWSPYQDGLLQVWKDGKLVLDRKGPIGFNDKVGPYFKMGLYKGWHDRATPAGVVSQRTVFHDEVRVAGPGGTYSDVAPPGATAQEKPAARPKAPAKLTIGD